jgi:phosphoribosyl 1,2-cyclic phosphodiesterase
MNIYVLASGSKGNMTLIQSQNHWLCLDVGISIKKIEEKLEYLSLKKDFKCDILITHEHGDHTQGLKAFVSKGYARNVYINKGTLEGLKRDVYETIIDHVIVFEHPFDVGDYKVTPFRVSHDAKDPVGFTVEIDTKKMVLITDTGYLDVQNEVFIQDADVYLIEANHQPNTLLQSKRPYLLKRRILSEQGHLSNEDAAKLINKVMGDKPTHWIVMHISEDCNSVLDIEKAVVKYVKNPLNIHIYYTGQDHITEVSI